MKEVWNERRDATVRELMHADAIGPIEGDQVRGIEAFMQYRASLLAAFPDLKITIDGLISDGDDVVLRWSVTGTHVGPQLGIAPTQRAVVFRGMSWLRFSNGLLVEGWDSWNQGGLLAELQPAA
jgi:predicted ester cyclase